MLTSQERNLEHLNVQVLETHENRGQYPRIRWGAKGEKGEKTA